MAATAPMTPQRCFMTCTLPDRTTGRTVCPPSRKLTPRPPERVRAELHQCAPRLARYFRGGPAGIQVPDRGPVGGEVRRRDPLVEAGILALEPVPGLAGRVLASLADGRRQIQHDGE